MHIKFSEDVIPVTEFKVNPGKMINFGRTAGYGCAINTTSGQVWFVIAGIFP